MATSAPLRRLHLSLLLLFLLAGSLTAQELRATWVARNSLNSRESIAALMDTLAKNNFNVVYINAWSRGYPLWKSDVFFRETGIYIDPTFAGRDILAEAVAEGHRVGLHVEAWFEYGFVGGWTGNQPVGVKGPIFTAHPNWVASKRDGTELDGSNFYWMVHTRPDVQNFLIAMAAEVARKYDIDGIELDRIRYSSTDYGYDAYTDSLWRAENNNQPLPASGSDPAFIRWRADKLNAFIARAYDSIKAVSSFINVSNAPSLYSASSYTAYNSFCQDWVWWVNNGKVDNIQVQSYVGTASAFTSIISYLGTLITNKTKAYPACAVVVNSTTIPITELVGMVNATRSQGYKGNAVWYYTDLLSVFPQLKASVYQQKTHPPFTPADWRSYVSIVPVSDTVNAVRAGSWAPSTLIGYSGASISAAFGSPASVSYYLNVPVSGTYEVYAYNVTASNRADSAVYLLYDSLGNTVKTVQNQTVANNRRFQKLADIRLKQGRQLVAKLSSEALRSGQVLSADALMISLNRKNSPGSTTAVEKEESSSKKKVNGSLSIFPVPASGAIAVAVSLPAPADGTITMVDCLGREVWAGAFSSAEGSAFNVPIPSGKLPAGIYFVSLKTGSTVLVGKASIIK